MDSIVNGGKSLPVKFAYRVNDEVTPRSVVSASLSSGQVVVGDTATPAAVGDIFRPESGALQYQEIVVTAVSTNSFTIATTSLPAAADTFFLLRPVTQRNDASGAQIVTIGNSPIQYRLNATATEVKKDTGTPANSRPLPIEYLDSTGAQVNLATKEQLPAALGSAAAASSLGVTASTEDIARIGIITEAAPASDTASSGLNGRLQRIAQRLTSLIALLPTSLGTKAAASSLATTWSTEDEALIGALTEAAPASDTASSGLNGRLQRVAQRITSLIALVPASLGQKASASSYAVVLSTEQEAEIGALTEAAPASDTASSGLNGRLQRIAQRLTSLIALLPASLGSKAAASSFAVTSSTEDTALMGALTETAPASDTASSGHNGRLQRIAQRLTSLIALLPTSLGQKTMSASLGVTIASDQSAITVTPGVKAAVTVKQAKITVGTSAVRLTTDAAAPSATRQNLTFMVDPASTANFYIGSSGVTTSTGLPAFPGQNLQYKDDANDYYIISDTAAQSVYIVEAE